MGWIALKSINNFLKNKKIIYFAFLLSFSWCQNLWFKGNLKGIDDLSFELKVKGIEDDVWEEKIYTYVKLKLMERDIQLLENLVPKMVLDLNIIDSRVEQVSSFLVQLSIYGYSISESDYYKSFSDSKISKGLMTSKIFSYEIMGQTSSIKLYKDIEKNINNILSLFLNQWYNDNPKKQF